MTVETAAPVMRIPEEKGYRPPRRRVFLHIFLIFIAVIWLFPLAYAVYTSFRTYADTQQH